MLHFCHTGDSTLLVIYILSYLILKQQKVFTIHSLSLDAEHSQNTVPTNKVKVRIVAKIDSLR